MKVILLFFTIMFSANIFAQQCLGIPDQLTEALGANPSDYMLVKKPFANTRFELSEEDGSYAGEKQGYLVFTRSPGGVEYGIAFFNSVDPSQQILMVANQESSEQGPQIPTAGTITDATMSSELVEYDGENYPDKKCPGVINLENVQANNVTLRIRFLQGTQKLQADWSTTSQHVEMDGDKQTSGFIKSGDHFFMAKNVPVAQTKYLRLNFSSAGSEEPKNIGSCIVAYETSGFSAYQPTLYLEEHSGNVTCRIFNRQLQIFLNS